jgi:hypothetical protein
MSWLKTSAPWRLLAAILCLGFAVRMAMTAGFTPLLAVLVLAGAYNLILAIAIILKQRKARAAEPPAPRHMAGPGA